jgi:predicted aspartyl protease
MLNSLPVICAALVSGAGAPAGIEALQASAWNRPDSRSRLEAFLGSSAVDDPNRLAAMVTLRDISMAESDYPRAHAWHQRATELAGNSSLHLSEDLLDAPPQIAKIEDDTIPIVWGLIGLPRVDARFGATRVSALVDTGAQYAVISESLARRAGLTYLQGPVTVMGSSSRTVQAGVGLAEITLGRSQFSNALVLIIPDEALALPMGFKIDAIIGIPQLRAFAALEFSQQSLRTFTVAESQSDLEPNIAFDGWRLIAPVRVDDEQAWMLIDTGARRSSLYTPHDEAAQIDNTVTIRGLGGARRVRGETGRATLQLGEQSATVSELRRVVLNNPSQGCRAPQPTSILGQDFLRRRAYRINFTTMRLDWMP